MYARSPILAVGDAAESVLALSRTEQLAYQAEPGSGRILIIGVHERSINTAAARMAREMVRAVLHRDGWTPTTP